VSPGRELCADPRASIAAAVVSLVGAVAVLVLPHWLAVSTLLLGAAVWSGVAVAALRATPPPLPPRSPARRPTGTAVADAVADAIRTLEVEGVPGR